MKQKRMRAIHLLGIIFLIVVSIRCETNAKNADCDKIVSYLIDTTAGSGLTFIRNDTEYSGQDAALHFMKKYRHLQAKINTPEDFIIKVGTRSMLSGKPYYVRLKTGEKYPCSEWLYLILMQYKESPGDRKGKEGSEESITVMTLNMAHARKGTSNGTKNKRNRIENNLNHIVKVITHEHPLVVALQEADGETYRPDNFNQVEFISEKAKYPYIETGYHVIKKNFVYGTALLSLYPLSHTEMTTFLPSPPTPLKGFVVSRMKWPFPSWNKEVDVISLHLDFLRKHVRMKQVEQIIQKLKTRGKPLIVMGDFNCEPDIRENTLQYFCENLNLKMYNPYSVELVTFQLFKKRLDWILISPDFEFKSYRVLKDKISDHSGVIAEIAVRKQS